MIDKRKSKLIIKTLERKLKYNGIVDMLEFITYINVHIKGVTKQDLIQSLSNSKPSKPIEIVGFTDIETQQTTYQFRYK